MLLLLHHLTQVVSQVVTAYSKTGGPSKAVLHAWWQALLGTTSKSPRVGLLSPGVRFLVTGFGAKQEANILASMHQPATIVLQVKGCNLAGATCMLLAVT